MSTTKYGNSWNIFVALVSLIGLIFVLMQISVNTHPNQTIKAKQSEAKLYIASINKGQQAYYAVNQELSDNISDLGIGIRLETTNYSYDISRINSSRYAISTATAKNEQLKSYSGIVYIDIVHVGYNSTKSMICETDEPSLTAPDNFEYVKVCPSGSSEL